MYRKAAEIGNTAAQNNLGLMYSKGEGVPKNAVQAVAWYRKAAEKREAAAQTNLGWMYEKGEGVPKDAVQAVAWYRKAAEQGYAKAQFNLGVMYVTGKGVPKNKVIAYGLFNNAGVQNAKAVEYRDIVEKELNPEQIAAAQKLSQEIVNGKPLSKVLPAYEKYNAR